MQLIWRQKEPSGESAYVDSTASSCNRRRSGRSTARSSYPVKLDRTNMSSTGINRRPQPVTLPSSNINQTSTITTMSSGQTLLSSNLLSLWKTGFRCIQDVQHLLSINYHGQDHGLGDSWTSPALLVSILPKLRFLLSNHLSLYSYAAAFITVLMLLYKVISCRTAMRCLSGQETYSHIHALTKFMVPTRSIWPPNYFDSRSWVDVRSRKAELSVGNLFRDLIQGRIELRKPVRNLPLLIKEQLHLDGWSFGLSITMKDRVQTLLSNFGERMVFGGDVSGYFFVWLGFTHTKFR